MTTPATEPRRPAPPTRVDSFRYVLEVHAEDRRVLTAADAAVVLEAFRRSSQPGPDRFLLAVCLNVPRGLVLEGCPNGSVAMRFEQGGQSLLVEVLSERGKRGGEVCAAANKALEGTGLSVSC